MTRSVDVVVIGAGMAGASVAANLAATHRVVLLERESQPGYHSTGRSAALFSTIYGCAPVRALTRASRSFFMNPGEGFCDVPLVHPRGTLYIARPEQVAALEAFAAEPGVAGGSHRVDAAAARRISPLLREGYVAEGLYEPEARDIEVHALHQGYLRQLRAAGGDLVTDADVEAIERRGSGWHVRTRSHAFEAPVVVNASGAWAEATATLAGVAGIGLKPLRRTAVLVEIPDGQPDFHASPLTIDIDEAFYFKPDAGLLLLSPADETPSPPCDAAADEMDIAVAIDRVETATTLQVRRVRSSWAGLRSFVADRTPVVGFDPFAEGFFWLAGQGGYGIQTAPALGRLAADLITGRPVPADIADQGLALADLAPERLEAARAC